MKIEIICKNTGKRKLYPQGTTLRQIAQDLNIKLKDDILGAKVNNKLRELDYEVYKPKTVEFIDVNDPAGFNMYTCSVIFVLFKAVRDLWPDKTLKVEHSLPIGSYCELINKEGKTVSCTPDMVKKIGRRAEEIIAADLPITRKEVTTEEAVKFFRKNGLPNKALLFENRVSLYTSVYTLDNVSNYFYGFLVPSTGYLKYFKTEPYFEHGFIAFRPDIEGLLNGKDAAYYKNLIKKSCKNGSKLFKTFQEHKDWLEILGVPYVGNLNREIAEQGAGRLIKISEALQEKKIAGIADMIAQKKGCRIVLISGPSSSGKTSFCKRLSVQLQVAGFRTAEISLDDYFVNRELTPRDENGDYDFESLDAIDRTAFNKDLKKILAVKKEAVIKLPVFDFRSGTRIADAKSVKITPKTIIIVEGIHGLNPRLTEIDSRYTFKVFVSALTHISIDAQNPVSSTDNRIIRRMVRDHFFRGYPAVETLNRWASVRRGENKNIFPYQENADVIFNSALLFELSVLKKYAEPLLREIPESNPHYGNAHRLLKFLSFFKSIEENEIPPTSLLREFLGGSSFVY